MLSMAYYLIFKEQLFKNSYGGFVDNFFMGYLFGVFVFCWPLSLPFIRLFGILND